MRGRLFSILFLSVWTCGAAGAIDRPVTGSKAFEQALHAALLDPAQALSMQVDCTNEQGIRSLHLYPEGVAVWNKQVQVEVDKPLRTSLLKELLNADFLFFCGPVWQQRRERRAHHCMCSIQVQTGGMEKASYQDLNGDRSVAFMKLATALWTALSRLPSRCSRHFDG